MNPTAYNKRRWVIFGLSVSLFLMSMFYRVSGAIIAPDLRRDLNLGPQDLGLLGASFFYTFALVQLPLGLFLDRIGAKITMVALNLTGVTGIIIFAMAEDMAGGVIGRALMGLGMAANLMGTLKLFTHWFDLKKFATLSGLAISLGYLGSLAATSPLALLVRALGWRGSFYCLAGVHLILTFCLFIFARDAPPEKNKPDNIYPGKIVHPSIRTSITTLFLSWNYWAISLSIFLRYGAIVSIQALWAGPFLMEYLGLPAITAGNLLLMINVGSILGASIGGILSDRVFKSKKRTILFGLSISIMAVYNLSTWRGTSLLPLLGAILFLTGFFASFSQISYAHIRELMPDRMSGTAMSGINFFTMMGAGFFINGLGGVMKYMEPGLAGSANPYKTAFLICAAGLLISVFLYLTTSDSSSPQKGITRQSAK